MTIISSLVYFVLTIMALEPTCLCLCLYLRLCLCLVGGGVAEVGRRLAAAIRRQLFNRTDSHSAPAHTIASHVRLVDQGATVSFLPEPQLLRWGSTHNCSVCCASGTMAIEVCAASNCSDPAAVWRAVPAVTRGSELRADNLVQGAKSVRYAWSNYPECVLFDEHALPVGPFSLLVSS